MSVFFEWAVGRDMAAANLAAIVRKPAKETARERVLSDDELREVWIHADSLGWPFGPLVRALMLTGQRRNEVAGMRWEEVARKERMWSISGGRTKNRRAHAVPIATAFEEILDAAPRFDDDDSDDANAVQHVFTTNGKTPVSGFSRAKRRLDAAILEGRKKAAEEAGDDPKKARSPAHWTFHDLRRSAATGMAAAGVQPHVIESALNHVSGFRSGVAGVYQRHDFLAERRAALDLWAQHVVGLTEPERGAGKVVKLRGRR